MKLYHGHWLKYFRLGLVAWLWQFFPQPHLVHHQLWVLGLQSRTIGLRKRGLFTGFLSLQLDPGYDKLNWNLKKSYFLNRRLLKTIRLKVSDLLSEIESVDPEYRIVALFRDPRAIVNSIRNSPDPWTQGKRGPVSINPCRRGFLESAHALWCTVFFVTTWMH